VLGKGAVFGERALLEKKNSRTATVVCIEDCEFGVIFKEDYD